MPREPQKKKIKKKNLETKQSLKPHRKILEQRKYYWRGFNMSEKIAYYNRSNPGEKKEVKKLLQISLFKSLS